MNFSILRALIRPTLQTNKYSPDSSPRFLYYISKLQSRSTSTGLLLLQKKTWQQQEKPTSFEYVRRRLAGANTNKWTKHALIRSKEENSPSHVKSSFFFSPRNKPLTLKQTFIPKGKKNKSLSLQHDCTSRKKPVKDPDNSRRQRVTWFILSKGRKIFSLGKGGRGNKINKNRPFLCV